MPVDVQHPILVKIAPDLTEVDKEDIAAVVTRKQVCFVLFGPGGFVLLNYGSSEFEKYFTSVDKLLECDDF